MRTAGQSVKRRLQALNELFDEYKLDAVLLYGRENSRYFCGFTGTTSYALIGKEKRYFFTDSRYTEQAKAECPMFQIIQPEGALLTALLDILSQEKWQRVGIEEESLTVKSHQQLLTILKPEQWRPLSTALAGLRWIKEESELQAIRRAVEIADEAFAATWPLMKVGMSELDCAALLEYNMKKRGAQKASFDTIIASGLRSALPHGLASDKKLEAGDVVVMDFGAVYDGYCSDITRSVFIDHVPEELRRIYELVLDAQLRAEEKLCAGMSGREADRLARLPIEEAGYGHCFGHGLGHSLGLAVHESPALSPKSDEILPAGVLLTVEPGIYVPGLGGVRIEDTVLLREKDIEILTQAPKDLICIQ